MPIKEQLQKIKSELPENITLVAVSKTKPIEAISEAYEAGHRVFGENKIQEMTQKWEELPKDIKWHMIGHVQRNKVKYIAPYVSLIHGVDSLKLLKEINKQAQKHNRVIDCLLQIHISEETSKFGLNSVELNYMISNIEFETFQNIKIKGVMGMATFTQRTDQIQKEFKNLKKIFDQLQEKLPHINTLSMGMSGDYKIALKEGSNMIRIGSSIFGERNYQ